MWPANASVDRRHPSGLIDDDPADSMRKPHLSSVTTLTVDRVRSPGCSAPGCGCAVEPLATRAIRRYPDLWTVSMTRGERALSSNARRSLMMAAETASSPTNGPPQTASRRSAHETTTPGCAARRTSTCITLGSRRRVFSPLAIWCAATSSCQPSTTRSAPLIRRNLVGTASVALYGSVAALDEYGTQRNTHSPSAVSAP